MRIFSTTWPTFYRVSRQNTNLGQRDPRKHINISFCQIPLSKLIPAEIPGAQKYSQAQHSLFLFLRRPPRAKSAHLSQNWVAWKRTEQCFVVGLASMHSCVAYSVKQKQKSEFERTCVPFKSVPLRKWRMKGLLFLFSVGVSNSDDDYTLHPAFFAY